MTMMRARLEVGRTTWAAIYDCALRPGPSDVRPCGCINDPYVFGHYCPQETPRWPR